MFRAKITFTSCFDHGGYENIITHFLYVSALSALDAGDRSAMSFLRQDRAPMPAPTI